MRKIWAFFWHQNLWKFEKNLKQSDRAPLICKCYVIPIKVSWETSMCYWTKMLNKKKKKKKILDYISVTQLVWQTKVSKKIQFAEIMFSFHLIKMTACMLGQNFKVGCTKLKPYTVCKIKEIMLYMEAKFTKRMDIFQKEVSDKVEKN